MLKTKDLTGSHRSVESALFRRQVLCVSGSSVFSPIELAERKWSNAARCSACRLRQPTPRRRSPTRKERTRNRNANDARPARQATWFRLGLSR